MVKFKLFLIILIFLVTGKHFAQVTMTLSNGQLIDSKTFQFDVYIKSNSGNYTVNSYQCALFFNQAIVNGTIFLSYVVGSSAISNPPTAGIGAPLDGSHFELTFGSATSDFTISTGDVLVGTFRIGSVNDFGVATPDIVWDFSDTYKTKLQNSSLVDITSGCTFVNLSYSQPLPVELSSFTASINQNAVSLKWQTKTEVDNYGFEVERASSITSPIQGWEKIGFVPGNGNSNSPKDYTLTDKYPTGGSKFVYRLKQIDNDGKVEYSDEVEIELIPNEFTLYQNYPNPFNPATNIKFALPKAAKVTLLVYNLLGEKVAALLNEDKDAGFYDIQFNASNLSTGVYIYRLTAGDFVQTKKMTLMK